MRNTTLLAVSIVLCFTASAFADDIVFDLSPATGVASFQESFGTGQGVSVQTTQTISDMEFWLSMPNGGDLKFMIWAGDLNNLLFLTTVSDVTPFYLPKWISSGPMNFTLQAGQDYWFAIISDVTIYVGYIFPEMNYSNHGLTAFTAPGNALFSDYDNPYFNGNYGGNGQIALRLSEVPEPGGILLMGSGVLGLAGVLRRKLF